MAEPDTTPEPPPHPRLPERKPWPMKWVIVAIGVFIVPYTWITLHFRKSGPAYEPYAEARDRKTVTGLLAGGWQRIPLDTYLPADQGLSQGTPAKVTEVPGGVPYDLSQGFAEMPLIPTGVSDVTATAEIGTKAPYIIEFTCKVPNNQEHLVDAYAYRKGDTIQVLTQLERIDADLLERSRENRVRLVLPENALPPGHYELRVVGSRNTAKWELDVR